jgi:hypothetical protein
MINLLDKLARYYAVSEVGIEHITDLEPTDEEMDTLIVILKDSKMEQKFNELIEKYKKDILKSNKDKKKKI